MYMKKVREVIAYKDHFEDFLKKQPAKVQNKIFKVIEAIETLERNSCKVFKNNIRNQWSLLSQNKIRF
jgi:hypothetical protein